MHAHELFWRDDRIGLQAVVVVDDLTLGPAVGGTRTKAYASLEEASRDARALSRAMTLKCALANLDAGGCKLVVRQLPTMDRARVFEELGRRIADLQLDIRTAGDFGTCGADLKRMAMHTDRVHEDGGALAASTARGHLGCVRACLANRGVPITSVTVAVQGCGAIGSAVAAALSTAGARVRVADIDSRRAEKVANAIGGDVVDAEDVLTAPVDIIAPCAIGGVLDSSIVQRLRAWAVVGAANNILADETVAGALRQRNIIMIPDVIASAGAVVDGVGATMMGLDDRSALIDRLGLVAEQVLDRAEDGKLTTIEAAEAIAAERLGRMKRLLYVS